MKIAVKNELCGWILSLPAIVGTVFVYIYPTVRAVITSLHNNIELDEFVGFRNYFELFESTAFRLALKNTILFNLIAIPLIVLLPFILAEYVNRNRRITGIVQKSVFFSILIPSASLMVYVDLVCGKNGIIVSVLDLDTDIYNSQYAFALLIILYLFKYGGFNYFIYTVILNRIDQSYYEEAYISGASVWQSIQYITLPFCLPYTVIVIVLSLMNAYKIYREAYLIGGYYPNEHIYLFQHFINNNFIHMNYTRLCCVSVVILLFTVLAVILVLGIFRLTWKNGVRKLMGKKQ